jgi:glycosyltransferase involved in cell wall biosynthesis
MSAQLVDSPAWGRTRPTLSVLIPFLRDDPRDLLAMLDREAPALAGAVEIVVLDDGTDDAALTAAITGVVHQAALPVRLITLARNEGRSIGRNRLATAANGDVLLFLDSDMRPDTPDFLARWLAVASDPANAVAFGGFSLKQAPDHPRFALHRAMAAKGECLDHVERSRAPEKYVYTSNLLVRREVFDAEAFDPAFTGWGWEDVEWAMRVSRRYPVVHIDNPATHMGLDTAADLARKYEQSAPNFARVSALHPDIVAAYPSHRVARLLKPVPARGLWRPWLKQAALSDALPMRLRAFSLRLYRAALYAGVV